MTSRDSDTLDALAWDVAAFLRDVDHYTYFDTFDTFEDGVEQARKTPGAVLLASVN